MAKPKLSEEQLEETLELIEEVTAQEDNNEAVNTNAASTADPTPAAASSKGKVKKVKVEKKTVEVLYKMKFNVLHNNVIYKQGEKPPVELVELFLEKGFVDKEFKEV